MAAMRSVMGLSPSPSATAAVPTLRPPSVAALTSNPSMYSMSSGVHGSPSISVDAFQARLGDVFGFLDEVDRGYGFNYYHSSTYVVPRCACDVHVLCT